MAETVRDTTLRMQAMSLSNDTGNPTHARVYPLVVHAAYIYGILRAFALLFPSPCERPLMASPNDKALLQELSAAWDDLTQLVDWWRARKAFYDQDQDPVWATELHTYHIARIYIDLIKRHADIECTTQKEIINRALQQFFAGSAITADRQSSGSLNS